MQPSRPKPGSGSWSTIVIALVVLVLGCGCYGIVHESLRSECEQRGGHLETKFLNNPRYGYTCVVDDADK